MRRIKKGDEVVVIAGRDKGRRGSVMRVMDNGRVIVENVNIIKKHVKANPGKGTGGGIMEKEAAIHPSNVMLFDAASGKGSRVGVRTLGDGRKVRFFKSNGEVLDV